MFSHYFSEGHDNKHNETSVNKLNYAQELLFTNFLKPNRLITFAMVARSIEKLEICHLYCRAMISQANLDNWHYGKPDELYHGDQDAPTQMHYIHPDAAT